MNRTLSNVCPGLLANPGPTSKKSDNLPAQRVKASAYRRACYRLSWGGDPGAGNSGAMLAGACVGPAQP